jgi:hypothetical protein
MILGAQSVDCLRGVETEDEYHNTVIDWDTPAAATISGCSVQPGGGLQVNDSREAITTLFTVWAPEGSDVADTDRIRYAGTVYDIDGPVERWDVGSGLDHLVIRLKAVSG